MRAAFLAACGLAALAAGLSPAPAGDPAPTVDEFRRSADNLKQIVVACHNYEAATGHLPNNVYKEGRALLSWRVLLLPYLDEGRLYEQFNPAEPWDGPANKALVEKMPRVYAPVRGPGKAGETYYHGFVTDRGPFGPEAGKGLPLDRIPDGTANTGLVFEAGEPVVWTRPDDLVLPAKGPVPRLGGMFGGVAQVGMADGSVLKLRADPDATELRRLIDPADGGKVDLDKLRAR